MNEGDYSELGSQLKKIQDDFTRLSEENEALQARCNRLQEIVDNVDDDPRVGFAKLLYAITYSNKRTESTRDSSGRILKREVDFREWENGIIAVHRKREIRYASLAFSVAVNLIPKTSSDFRKIPFVGYDFFNQVAMITPAALELFGVNERKTRWEIPFNDLIKLNVSSNYRQAIFDAFNNGQALENYHFLSLRGGRREIILDGYPLVYEDGTIRELVGSGVFFRYHNNNPFSLYSARRFAVCVRRVIKKLGEGFKIIKYNAGRK